jgi:uncharacterized OsmC-like protein
MTQLERYAQMMKVNLGSVKAHVALHVAAEGSVLAQTVQARREKIAIHYDIESPDEPAKVAGVIRNARNGCYVRQTIGRPEIFQDTITLNGQPFNVDDYPPPAHR